MDIETRIALGFLICFVAGLFIGWLVTWQKYHQEDEKRKAVENAIRYERIKTPPKTEWDEIDAWLKKQGEHKPTDMSIKEKAHQIAWETSKHYDPLLSKESWCEMAALDMASWLEKQGEQKSTLRERYKNIAKSEWFKRTYDGMSVSDEESKWTEGDDGMLDATECWLDTLCEYLKDSSSECIPNVASCIEWLKSLKQRIKERQ